MQTTARAEPRSEKESDSDRVLLLFLGRLAQEDSLMEFETAPDAAMPNTTYSATVLPAGEGGNGTRGVVASVGGCRCMHASCA